MILIDANILINAVNDTSPLHGKARPWLEAVLAGTETVGFPWIALLAFVRIATRPGIFPHPLSIQAALDLVDVWLRQAPATIVHPGPGHFDVLRRLLLFAGAGGNLTTDAHLAAMAIECGAEMCSSDADFSRFPGLKWRNPLA